jgi:superfamily II DNA or RNA helicase
MSDKKLQKKKEREKRLKSERVKQSRMYEAEWNMNLAADAYRAKNYKTALLYLNKVFHIKPDWSHALRMRAGIAMEYERDYAAAIPCIEKLIRKDEDDTNAIFSLANCYFEERRYAEEIELLEKFLERMKVRRDKSAREERERAKAWIKESRKFMGYVRFDPQPSFQPLSGGKRIPTPSPFPIPEEAAGLSSLTADALRIDRKPVPTPVPNPTPSLPALDLSPFTDPRNLRIKAPLQFRESGLDFGEKIAITPPDSPADYLLRLHYHRLRLVREFEELICLEHLKGVNHYWYQVETAFNVLKRFRGRVLLADEVGLGKTIEAGMLIKEYLLRGLARKILVLTPPTLVSQWQEEMAEKFALPFVTPDHDAFREDGERFWQEQDLVIASINTAKSQRYFDVITAIDYDLVVVDEAHYLRNKQTLNHRLVSAIRKRFIFLLSATPVQNNLLELYNLITLLQPGLLSTEAAFKKEYVKRGNLRQPNNPEKLRQLLREVMIRNTRSMVDVKLPKRFATTFYVPPTEEEKETYEELSAGIRLLHETAKSPELFTVRNLQMAAGSSPFALKESIGHFLARLSGGGTDGSVQAIFTEIQRKLADIRTTSKGLHLLSLLQQNQERKLVFVRYLQTLEYLSSLLKDNGYPFAVFSGAMTAREKDAAVEAFRGDIPILLSTETGGEGRNIQFCNTLINYDLPWNPMRLEQRIGRIHRIGQERDVFIFNLCLQGSIEDYMMRILDDKINMFELVIGEIDTILGNLETDRDFSSLILDVWLRSGAADERRANFARLGDEILAAKRTYEQTKALDEMIFGDDYEV